MPTTEKTVMSLQFDPPGKDAEKTQSKNYDILFRPNAEEEKQQPLLLGANGRLYIRKGVIDPAKVKSITITVTVVSK